MNYFFAYVVSTQFDILFNDKFLLILGGVCGHLHIK